MVNFLLTVVGAFVFAFFAAGAAGFSLPVVSHFKQYFRVKHLFFLVQCVFSGLFVGILVFIADLYFLVKVPRVLDGSKGPKSLVKKD